MIKLLVLGVLNMQPMSGYEIKTMLELNDSQRWAGILPGSIYNALKKLEQAEYITIDSVESTGHRQKVVYKITEKGQDYQLQLIEEALANGKVSYPTELFSGLSFVYQLPNALALQQLEKNKQQLQQELDEIKQGMVAKNNAFQGEIPELSKIVFQHMLDTVYLQLNLVDRVMTSLEKNEKFF